MKDNKWERQIVNCLKANHPEYFSMPIEKLENKVRELDKEGVSLINSGYNLKSEADSIRILIKNFKQGVVQMDRYEKIMARVQEHYNEALQYFPESRIVGIFLQGSQNYHMEVPGSDVDTKLIVIPTFEEIAFNKKLASTTHVRENNEHIDFKDIRLMISTFRKQNLNFLEILFTNFKIVNPMYEQEWNRLIEKNEEIAHYNPFLAVKAMKGIAMEKFHALEHPYPTKLAVLDKYGYDPKQLHHLLRVEEYISRYINGDKYIDCLIPQNADYLKNIKLGQLNLSEARVEALRAMDHITRMSNDFCSYTPNVGNAETDILLNDVQLNIMRTAMKNEF
jgi:hypothetical protein